MLGRHAVIKMRRLLPIMFVCLACTPESEVSSASHWNFLENEIETLDSFEKLLENVKDPNYDITYEVEVYGCDDEIDKRACVVKGVTETLRLKKEHLEEFKHDLLMSKIFNKKLRISYYVDPTLECSEAQVAKLDQYIRNALNVWLDVLREDETIDGETIVSEFELVKAEKHIYGDEYNFNIHFNSIETISNLMGERVIRTGRSHMYAPDRLLMMRPSAEKHQHRKLSDHCPVHESGSENNNGNADWFSTPNTDNPCDQFSYLVLVHEIGHTFGLGDTYEGNSKSRRINSKTGKPHPPSVMSCNFEHEHGFVSECGCLTGLAQDDKDGIKAIKVLYDNLDKGG